MTRPVFVLSLPRSGSTLLQRLLAAHPDVATTAEPFVLLPLVYGLRPAGARSEYGHQLTAEAIEQFCRELPAGLDDYRAALRGAATELYRGASRGAPVFLDKTPAYSLVPDSVLELFPDADYVFLWRNPLAVAASISESWYGGRWTFRAHADYLTLALPRLVDAYRGAGDRVLAVRYEDLVADPHRGLEQVFAHLGVPFDDVVLDAFADVELRGDRKDTTGIARYRSLSDEPLTRWVEAFHNPVRRAWARRYLHDIGDDRLATMGYDRAELESALDGAPRGRRGAVRDAADVVRHAVGINARGRILRQDAGLRWL